MSRTLLFLAVITMGAVLRAESITGTVVKVKYGDQLMVASGSNEEVDVRLYGVICPAFKQPYGDKARDFTRALATNKVVVVDVRKRDSKGRPIGEVVLQADKQSINAELVKAGLAWHYKKYAPEDTRLAGLEAAARAVHAGLWADAHPVPPWEYWDNRNRGPNAAGGAP